MLETAKYFLDYFFNWSVTGSFWHFILAAFLCWLLGSPTRVNVDNSIKGYTPENTSNLLTERKDVK